MTNDVEITLLTEKEYKKYKNIIPVIESTWWLRSMHDYAANISSDGSCAYNTSYGVAYPYGIRPALHMKLANPKHLVSGDHIRIGSKTFTVLSWKRSNLFAFCNEVIEKRRFDTESYEWESSELKAWLETEGLKLIF